VYRRHHVQRPQQHFLAAASGGHHADARLHQSHVQLGVGVPARAVDGDFGSAAQAERVRGHHHRTRAEFDGRRHALECPDGEIDVVPLLFLRAQQQLHQVGADGEVLRIAPDHECLEIPHGAAPRRERLRHQAYDVLTHGVLFGVEFQAGHAVAQID
jgi:hypothetical protein